MDGACSILYLALSLLPEGEGNTKRHLFLPVLTATALFTG